MKVLASCCEIYMYIFQGSADNFYTQKQLLPEDLVSASQESRGVSVVLRMQEEYDHSYYFIASFVEDHFEHHAKHLSAWIFNQITLENMMQI